MRSALTHLRVAGVIILRLPDEGGLRDTAVQFVVRPKPRVLKILQLGAVTTLFAIAGAPAFLLMNYFVSNVISPPNGRYGMSLLPIFAIVLASWVRSRSTTLLLALFAFAVYATEWGTIALADSVRPH